MTVGDLKKLLEDVEDRAKLVTFDDFGRVLELDKCDFNRALIIEGHRSYDGSGDPAIEVTTPYYDPVED